MRIIVERDREKKKGRRVICCCLNRCKLLAIKTKHSGSFK